MESLTFGLLGLGVYALWAFGNSRHKHKASTEEKFDAKIQSFGWNEPNRKTEVVINKQVDKSKLLLENKSLLNFLDKHFDLFKIDPELYILNLEQVKYERQVSINRRLRGMLERKGLYYFEIDSLIINGSDAIRLMMADRIG